MLGYLDRVALLGGGLPIDLRPRASAPSRRACARPLGLGVPEAAARIVEVVNANMADALRIVSVERGHDPREFALMAFGGAGPVHAALLAEELADPRGDRAARRPARFSALGLVATDLRRDYVAHALRRLDERRSGREVAAVYARHGGGGPRDARRGRRAAGAPGAARAPADCRYRRQAYELTVPVARRAGDGGDASPRLAADFHDEASSRPMATPARDEPVQLREPARWPRSGAGRPRLSRRPDAGAAAAHAWSRARPASRRRASSAATCCRARRCRRARAARAPLVIEAMDTTVVVPPGWTAAWTDGGFIRLRPELTHGDEPMTALRCAPIPPRSRW